MSTIIPSRMSLKRVLLLLTSRFPGITTPRLWRAARLFLMCQGTLEKELKRERRKREELETDVVFINGHWRSVVRKRSKK